MQLPPRIKRVADRWIHRLAPVYWNRRWIEREQSFHDDNDAKSLAAARLPADETVGLRCVWVVEVYLASHATELKERLTELRLGKEEYGSAAPTVASILKQREHGGSTWPADLGYLVPPEKAARGSTGSAAILPRGIESAFFAAVTTIPGATVVVGQFRFDDETSKQIEEPFQTLYRAAAVRRDDGTVTLPFGTHLRDEAVIELRSNLRRRCQRWMHDNLPGAFASLSEESPTCELITFATGDPFNGRGHAGRFANHSTLIGPPLPDEGPQARGMGDEDYLTILDQRGGSYAWGCVEMRGLALRLNRRADSIWPDQNSLVLSARVRDFDFDMKDNSSGTVEGVVANTYWLNQTLGIFALSRMAVVLESRLATLRDEVGTVTLNRTRKAVSQMQMIETLLAEVTRDARPLLKGIAAAPDWVLRQETYTFIPFDDFDRRNGPLFSAMAADLVERATRVLASEEELRMTVQGLSGLVAASANLASARSNIRLQRVAIVIATVALVVSAFAPEVHTWIQQLWQSISNGLRSR